MVDFVNKLKLNDKNYQYNGTVRDGSYKVKFLFLIKDFYLFITNSQSMVFMSPKIIKR